MAGITATDVVTQWGDYIQDRGQDASNLNEVLRESLEKELPHFTVIESEDTILQRSNVAYAEVLQAFQKGFTPKGNVTFTPNEIRLHRVKADITFTPDDLVDSWLSFLTNTKVLDRSQWPFIRWIQEVYVPGQISADIVNNMYAAVYVAPTIGTPGAASASFNGWKKIINDAITAGSITPIVTGALNATPSTMTGQFENFVKAIPELYQHVPKALLVRRAIEQRYKEGKRSLYAAINNTTEVSREIIDFEENIVVGTAAMAASNKIICSPKVNSIVAFKAFKNMKELEVEKSKREVHVYTDFHVGLGYNDYRLVWTNDQELT